VSSTFPFVSRHLSTPVFTACASHFLPAGTHQLNHAAALEQTGNDDLGGAPAPQLVAGEVAVHMCVDTVRYECCMFRQRRKRTSMVMYVTSFVRC